MTFGKTCVRAFPLVAVLFCVTVRPPVTPASELNAETLAANRELDQKFLNGHAIKSSESLVSLFSSRPDVVFIAPSGADAKRYALRLTIFSRFLMRYTARLSRCRIFALATRSPR